MICIYFHGIASCTYPQIAHTSNYWKNPICPSLPQCQQQQRGFSSQVLTLQALQFSEITDKHPVQDVPIISQVGRLQSMMERGHRLEVQGPQSEVGPSTINLLLLQYTLTLKTRRDSSSLWLGSGGRKESLQVWGQPGLQSTEITVSFIVFS